MGGRAEPLAFDVDVTAPFVRRRRDTPDPAETVRAPIPCDERISGYHLRYVLATGGMATVYLAVADDPHAQAGRRKEPPHRVVALKRIHPHLALQKEYVEMFLDEARITALVRHPNVCGVLDYGVVRGAGGEGVDAWWLAMELLAGQPLAKIITTRAERGPDVKLDERWPHVVAHMLAGACDGLHAAHELRDTTGRPLEVVHRDVSPHNLIGGFDGRVRVVDFGIALAKQRVHHTAEGFVKGKFAYMAPEQMRGQRVDRRADVWSLGVVLWEAIAGKPLFRRRNDSETILAVLAPERPSLRAIAPSVPASIAAIADRALSLDPAGRYATAAEMRDELAKAASTDEREVARWMANLFPDAERTHDELVSRATGSSSPRTKRAAVVRSARTTPTSDRPALAMSSSERFLRSAVFRTMRHARHEGRAWTVGSIIVIAACLLAFAMVLRSVLQ